MLGIDEGEIASPEFAQVFGGNALLEGMQPYAANYGGHQFGHWAGQLGDGRAITLGEVINDAGERWELQLKGAGKTPYSRSADGRAVLRSSIREFLCSEAMHHLGVPTTRALCLVATGEEVVRDMFYDGHPRAEPGAIVCRVAPSFIRPGNFELPASRGDTKLVRDLVDFTIRRDFPHLLANGDKAKAIADAPLNETQRAAWFAEVCERTARMVAHWMRVGFVHGVMNTDNLSILGLTIDYGPYGWIDNFDLDWTPNTTDAHGRRYRFGQQPQVAHWNLIQFANALVPVFESTEPLEAGLGRYVDAYAKTERELLAAKLGFSAFVDDDTELVRQLYALLQSAEIDMTLSSGRSPTSISTRRHRHLLPPRSTTRQSVAKPSRRLPTGSSVRCADALRRHGATRTPCANARGQSPICPAQLSCTTGDRSRRAGRLRRDRRAARCAAAALRRAAGTRALRRAPARLGARQSRLLDAVVQLLSSAAIRG
jgi:uncharacterized protein YdiU (UPF0061 family)